MLIMLHQQLIMLHHLPLLTMLQLIMLIMQHHQLSVMQHITLLHQQSLIIMLPHFRMLIIMLHQLLLHMQLHLLIMVHIMVPQAIQASLIMASMVFMVHTFINMENVFALFVCCKYKCSKYKFCTLLIYTFYFFASKNL